MNDVGSPLFCVVIDVSLHDFPIVVWVREENPNRLLVATRCGQPSGGADLELLIVEFAAPPRLSVVGAELLDQVRATFYVVEANLSYKLEKSE